MRVLDTRTADEIDSRAKELLAWYLREAGVTGIAAVEARGALPALTAIFGRFAERIIERLNRAPDKMFLAFLDQLGVSRLRPQPARVPLTFQMAAGREELVVVPQGTQVAAPPAKNATEPVVFETERELVVTPLRFTAAYWIDPAADQYYGWMPTAPDKLEATGPHAIEHSLSIALGESLALPKIGEIRLRLELEQGVPGTRQVAWEIYGPKGWTPLAPAEDTTAALSRSGEVAFKDPPPAEKVKIHGVESRWLRCTLLTRVLPGETLPTVVSLKYRVSAALQELPVKQAFSDNGAIDLTRDFYPFGPQPRFGSVFYLLSPEAFAVPDAGVDLEIELTNPAAGGPEPPIPRTNAANRPALAWERWDGTRWTMFGVSQTAADKTERFPDFEDTTRAFTQSGHVRFRLPNGAGLTTVNGVDGPWVRVRIGRGDYGRDPFYIPPPPQPPPAGPPPPPRNPLAPPSIHNLRISYAKLDTGVPPAILAMNDWKWTDHSAGGKFQPFRAADETRPTFHVGLERLVWGHRPGTRSVSLYFVTEGYSATSGEQPVPILWQYWNGADWVKWTVRDETASLTRSAPVRVLPPPDIVPAEQFERKAYWFRSFPSRIEAAALKRILLNAVMAAQSVSFTEEVLGASNGASGQVFRILHTPVLDGPRIEVREPQRPSKAECDELEESDVDQPVRPAVDALGRPNGVWVRWKEVPDFHGSTPHNRHFVLNHFTGEVFFGDGNFGMIPPAGSSNIQVSYRTGGGAAGNRDAGEITQMKTTVPYIDKAVNYEPSAGGVDAEDERELRLRGAAELRHYQRAVARHDYEDLAVLASPEVARAKCVPLRDLQEDPNGLVERTGAVSVIVVPRSSEPMPSPTRELLDRVTEYLTERCLPGIDLSVVGPDYLRIDVETDVVLESLDAGDVELAVIQALDRYLHPIFGGPDNTGWKFGRRVRVSDLYRIIEPVEGVSYISRLEIHEEELRPGVAATHRFLIFSGNHKVRVLPPES